MVVRAIQPAAPGQRQPPADAEQHQQLAEQLEQRNDHAAQEDNQRHGLHAAVIEAHYRAPERVLGSLAEQGEVHDRQKVGRQEQHQSRQHQRQAAALHLRAMGE
ncbi:hypothetical protein D3C81_1655230 [compost metagenome]